MKPPVIFIIYNRPDLTEKSLNAIRVYKPDQMYIVADGPKNEQDQILVDQTRLIIEKIDWDCEIKKNYAKENMGCGKRVSSGITWAFETCDQAIIIEDDCIPDLSFFRYCQELLVRYENEQRIGIISGFCYVDASEIKESYFFSQYANIWGWATWRRVWQNYDFSMKDWPVYKNQRYFWKHAPSRYYADKMFNIFEKVYHGKIDTWSYQLLYTLWKNNQLGVTPKHNLVKNIGFGPRATHTKDTASKYSNFPTEKLIFPLIHPEEIEVNQSLEKMEWERIFGLPSSKLSILKKKSKRIIKRILRI